MSQEAVHSVILKKSGNKLIYKNPNDEGLYKLFVNSLSEDHLVHLFFEANLTDGTYTQISKIKVCIRELAKEIGDTFENVEKEIKTATGLSSEVNGVTEYKSFADCSKDELSLTIQTLIEKGDFVNINFR
jgi:hypothetical protein